jgi:hypothetical protein
MLTSLSQGLRTRGCSKKGTRFVFITEGHAEKTPRDAKQRTLNRLQAVGFRVHSHVNIKDGLQSVISASLDDTDVDQTL